METDKEFLAVKVMTATPLELLDIAYEGLIDSLKEALEAPNDEIYYKSMNKAHDLLAELLKSLDMNQEISKDLMALYFYVQKLIVPAKIKRNNKKVEESIKILTPLHNSWHELAMEEEKLQTNNNYKKQTFVVAGMTYGKSDIDMVGNFGSEFKA